MRLWIADLVHHKVLAVLAAALLVSTTVGCSALGVESIRLPDGEVKVSGLAGAILTRLSDYNATIGRAGSLPVDLTPWLTRRRAAPRHIHPAPRLAGWHWAYRCCPTRTWTYTASSVPIPADGRRRGPSGPAGAVPSSAFPTAAASQLHSGTVPFIFWDPVEPDNLTSDKWTYNTIRHGDHDAVHHPVRPGRQGLWRPRAAAVRARDGWRLVPVGDRTLRQHQEELHPGVAACLQHLQVRGRAQREVRLVAERVSTASAASRSRTSTPATSMSITWRSADSTGALPNGRPWHRCWRPSSSSSRLSPSPSRS